MFKAQGQRIEPELLAVLRAGAFRPDSFKAAGLEEDELGPGEFIATASVFGNIDSYGEITAKGAFTETLAAWKAKGDPIPVIWQHDWGNPDAHIGEVVAIAETDEALVYKGRLDVDEPFAAKVYKLMKGRRITQQSYGFDILEAGQVTIDGKSAYEIRKVDLFEVGPCLVGVNSATNLLDIKSTTSSAAEPSAGGITPDPSVVVEPSGQVTTPAAGTESSATPGSDPTVPASKAKASPASVLLALSIDEFLGGIE